MEKKRITFDVKKVLQEQLKKECNDLNISVREFICGLLVHYFSSDEVIKQSLRDRIESKIV